MKRCYFSRLFFLFAFIFGSAACAQKQVDLPGSGTDAGGVCSEYYPTANRDVVYGFQEGDIFPCALFESVRKGSYDTPESMHLNIDDMYIAYALGNAAALKTQFGISAVQPGEYLAFFTAAINCPECKKYFADIAENSAQVENAGILPVAVGNKDLFEPENGLNEASSEELLRDDGWPERWLRTNDSSDVLTSQMAVWPVTIVIRLQDMRVLINGTTMTSVETLLAEIDIQNAVYPVVSDDDSTSAAEGDTGTPTSDTATETATVIETDSPGDSDTQDTLNETDTPIVDTSINIDCSACEGPVCVASVTGEIRFSDDTPCADCVVQICVPSCLQTSTNSKGEFFQLINDACKAYDWTADAPIHVQLLQHRDTHTTYSAAYTPGKQNLAENHNLHTGVHYLFPFPDAGEYYDGTASVTVNAEGLQLTVQPGELDTVRRGPFDIKAMQFPLHQWVPPFIKDASLIDALYVFSPYFRKFEEPGSRDTPWFADVTIDAATLGWEEGDTGSLWILGDFYGDFLRCNETSPVIPQGNFVSCRELSVDGSLLKTSIPRLGWIAVVKE